MKVLVVGHRRETRRLYQLLRGANRGGATYCSDSAQAVTVLDRSRGRYDYIFIEEQRKSNGSADIIGTIRAIDSDVPIAILKFAGKDTPADRRPRLFGVFERSPKGPQLLNCLLSAPNIEPAEEKMVHWGNLAFEYRKSRCNK